MCPLTLLQCDILFSMKIDGSKRMANPFEIRCFGFTIDSQEVADPKLLILIWMEEDIFRFMDKGQGHIKIYF